MYRGKSVAVVVTAYNEEGLVGDVIDDIPQFVDRVYVVDDASTDGTWQEVQERIERQDSRLATAKTDGGASPPTIVPFRHDENRGVGAAIKTGYRAALDDGMDVTAVMNGDGQMDPAILDRIIDPVVSGTAEYSKGNRLRSRDHFAEMSRWRLTGNVLLTFLTKIASGYWKMNDPQNGYTAISLETLRRIDVDELYDGYGFLNDILVKLNTAGCRIADVEMEAVYGNEESGIQYSAFVPSILLLLARSFFERLTVKYVITDFHPLVMFYVLGAVGILSGLGGAGWALFLAELRGVSALASLLLLLFSCSLVLWAITLDMRANESLENHLHSDF